MEAGIRVVCLAIERVSKPLYNSMMNLKSPKINV